MSRADCTVRTLAAVADITYALAEAIAADAGRAAGRRVKSAKVIERAKSAGISFRKVRYSGTLARFIRTHPEGRFYVRKRGHAFPVIDGAVGDATPLGCIVIDAWQLTAALAKLQ